MFCSFDILRQMRDNADSVFVDLSPSVRMVTFKMPRIRFINMARDGYRIIRGVAVTEDLYQKYIELSVPIKVIINAFLEDVDDLTIPISRGISTKQYTIKYDKTPF